jgi:SAF domain
MYLPPMVTDIRKKSQNRMFVAVALFLASIAASFLIAFISHQGSSYWVIRLPLPAGARITVEDVQLSKITIGPSISGYIPSSRTPVGSITKRSLAIGEILHQSALTQSTKALTSESISLPIRATDFPPTVKPGDLVSIYQLHDVRNGESAIAPKLIISPAFIEGISGKDRNFSGELSITVSLNRTDIPTLLAATTSGRLVVVAIRG